MKTCNSCEVCEPHGYCHYDRQVELEKDNKMLKDALKAHDVPEGDRLPGIFYMNSVNDLTISIQNAELENLKCQRRSLLGELATICGGPGIPRKGETENAYWLRRIVKVLTDPPEQPQPCKNFQDHIWFSQRGGLYRCTQCPWEKTYNELMLMSTQAQQSATIIEHHYE